MVVAGTLLVLGYLVCSCIVAVVAGMGFKRLSEED